MATTHAKRMEKLAKAKATYGSKDRMNSNHAMSSKKLVGYRVTVMWKEPDERGKMHERSEYVSGVMKYNKGDCFGQLFRRHTNILPATKISIMYDNI